MPKPDLRVDERVRRSMRAVVREAFVTGLAVVVPMLITVIVLAVALNYVYTYLDVFSDVVLQMSPQLYVPLYDGLVQREQLVEVLTPLVLLWTILVVGLVVNSSRYGERAVDYFDYAITRIPGVGSVYESFRRMSDVVLESDTQNFREVKLVEFPHEGAYTLGFVTTETPEALRRPAGHAEMLTLFLPLAPNPVMGGHLVHMPADRVMDVDMTVEEGIRAVVTSGVAVADTTGSRAGLDEERLRGLASVEHVDQQFDPRMDSPDPRPGGTGRPDRPDAYDQQVDPEQATTPDDIARRERDDGELSDDASEQGDDEPDRSRATPAEQADRDAEQRESTEERPAEAADRDADHREATEERPAAAADRDAEQREATEERPAEATDADEGDDR